MGKSNKNRSKTRADPIAKPTKPPADPELATIREKQILPVVNDLQSPDPSKRSAAAIAIANLIEDEKCRKLLLREQIVRILLEQTTTDAALESKSAGWGILRNLALEEEADFCVHLFRQDVLTAVAGIVANLYETVQSQQHPISKLPKNQQVLFWTLSSSITGLITSLAETNDEILQAISRNQNILTLFFTLLDHNDIPDELFVDILACLAALTEDNEPVANIIISQKGLLDGLISLKGNGGPRAVSACAVLHNIFTTMQWFDHNTPKTGASDAALVPVLVKSMSHGASQQNGNSTPDQVLQLALEITASIATTLQEALEHASKNEKEFEGFGDGEAEDSMMVEDDGDADDADDDVDNKEEREEEDDDDISSEMEADMDRVTGADDADDIDSEDQPTLVALVHTAVPSILQLVKSANEDIRDSALSALNNISWTLSSIDFTSSNPKIYERWSSLAQQLWSEVVSPVLASNTADIKLASAVTSLAWALSRSVQGRIPLQPEEQRKFMALYQASKTLPAPMNGVEKSGDNDTDPFQSLGVKCIGVLGRLALSPAPIELNREIGVFLLTTLSALPETPAADTVEALNQLFDIYADKDFACDEVFVKDGFIKHLEKILPKARTMAKGVDKRKDAELRVRADEVVLNLDRFIKYKRTEQRK